MEISTLLYYVFVLFPITYLGMTLTFYTLSALSISTPHSTFYARTLAAYGTLVLCAIYGVYASLLLRLIGKHRMSQWATARSFKWTMRYTTNVRFEIISGAQHLNRRPSVIIGNHQSALDILLLGTIWPLYCSVTAKSSLRYVPFLGWFMALSGTVFIDRTNRANAIQAFDNAAQEMRSARQSVFIFPEGTRSNARSAVLGAFKKGAFHLAVRAGVPVVPVVCANYHGVLSLKEGRFRAGRIPVVVLPPVETSGLGAGDVDRLMTETREAMLRALIDLTDSPAGQRATNADPSFVRERGELDHVAQSDRTGGDDGVGKGVASSIER